MQATKQADYTTMDWRDLVLWVLIAAAMVPLCWAGDLVLGSFDFPLGWRSRELLLVLIPLACVALVGAPVLAGMLGGPLLGRAFARGVALSTLCVAAMGFLLLMTDTLGRRGWGAAGLACGFALGLGWATALRRQQLVWVAGSTAWGLIAGWLGQSWNENEINGRIFGLVWALSGLPLAWLLRASYPVGERPASERWFNWRFGLPGGGAFLVLANLFRTVNCLYQLELGALYNVYSLQFAPDQQSIFLGGGSLSEWGAVERRSLRDGSVLQRFETGQGVVALGLTPDSTRLVGLDWADTVYVWDVVSGQELHRMQSIDRTIPQKPVFSSDSRYVAFRSTVYDLETGSIVGEVYTKEREQYGLLPSSSGIGFAWSPDGQYLATNVPWEEEESRSRGYAAAFDVGLFPSTKEDLWGEVERSDALKILPGPVNQIPRFSFSPDSTLLAGFYNTHYIDLGRSGIDNYVRVWRVADGKVLYEVSIEYGLSLETYSWSPDGQVLALSNQLGPVRLIQVAE
jgi:hypothetical protein